MALVNPLVYQAQIPGCSRETNCCSRKSFRKPLAPGGSSKRLCSRHQARGFHRQLPTALLNPWGWALLSHALGCPPRGLQMSMAEQGEGKGWPSCALTPPAQPPASWRTSERTFVWAAKLNLPPSCQGIGKAVRGEEKGENERGKQREGGKERGREEGGRARSPSYSGTACPGSWRLPGRHSRGYGHRTWDRAARPPGSGAGARRCWLAPGEAVSLCALLEGRGAKGRQRRKKFAAVQTPGM
ncbi:uncharacterized protein LOC128580536 [Nycticebus coucang]|uniref:uncharacterized protein LOC128580536 n=1 Tax=Nycticebus coucang TaxID=9470 RepID=UPI00234CE53F|nr:uncharacterized protein LOC128580536 [Nycticebus coucang]